MAWDRTGLFSTYVDSSHGNAHDGRSYGGLVITHHGGGALAWKCKAQDIVTKPLVGAIFERHRATILGHAHWKRQATDA